MKKIVKVGSRKSPLALVQTELVVREMKSHYPDWQFEIITMKTKGDKFLDTDIYKLGKGVFVKEIEEAMLLGTIDLAVHSLKDVPHILPDGLTISAVTQREDPRDVFISADGTGFFELKPGAKIGTSSLRRDAQLKQLRPDINCVPIRGNINTRIQKIETMQLDGIVIAAAGVKRLGLEDRITDYFTCEEVVPAVGQGVLAIETRADDKMPLFVGCINHKDTADAIKGERAFMKVLGGGCKQPMGAYGRVLDDDTVELIGMLDINGTVRRGKLLGKRADAQQLGISLAKKLEEGHER
ncbi:MAG TPA: hydroxymethylbilane synthase [Thermoanaerobacterales bacterium]|nr:hydroxymethylbilane synthase [Thermoanaerobacterales bacterium]